MSGVQLTFLANGESAERVIAQLEKKIGALENQVRQSRKSSSGLGADIVSSFTNAAISIGSMQNAVQLLKQELDDLQRRQKNMATANQTFAGSFRQAMLNLGKDETIKSPDELKAEISRISESTTATPKAVADALGSALSARGNMSAKEAAAAVEASLKLVPNIDEAQVPLAGAALDFRKLNKDASAESSLAFLMQLGTESRVTETTALAQNVAPAVASLMRSGASDQGAGAAVAALSQGMFDVEGRMSGTAAIALGQQLKEAFPDKKTFEERLELVQTDEKARQVFMQGGMWEGRKVQPASFERKAETAIESLLSGTGDVAANYREARERMPGLAGNERRYQELVDTLGGSSEQVIDLGIRQAEATKQQAQLDNLPGAQKGQAREIFDQAMEAGDAGYISRKARGLAMEGRMLFGENPYEAAATELKTYKNEAIGDPYFPVKSDAPQMQAIDKQIALLEKMAQQMETVAENTRRRAGGKDRGE